MPEGGDKFDVFIAVSYGPACALTRGNTGYRHFLEGLTNSFEQLGLQVYLAPRQEEWGEKRPSREVGIKKDLSALKQSQIFMIFLDGNESDGALVELGIAIGLGKTIWILRRTSQALPLYLTGILRAELACERKITSNSNVMDIARQIVIDAKI
jgi:hypothetical protein